MVITEFSLVVLVELLGDVTVITVDTGEGSLYNVASSMC